MKKIISFLISSVLLFTSVCAAPDGMYAQSTDIKVMLHGKEIPSCAVNNSMYIAVDDLLEYGYSVTYIDDVRTIFANKTGTPSDSFPQPCDVSRTTATDIQVILNGELVDQSNTFAANGKMYVNTSAITYYVSGNNVFDTGLPRHKYNLKAVWDSKQRIYNIDDSPMLSKQEQIDYFLSYNGNRENYSTFLGFTENHYRGENFDIVSLRIGGLPHGAQTFWYYFSDDGKSYSINTVTAPFKMHDAWGNSSIKNPRIEGRRLYFEGQRTMNLIEYSEGIYYGTYCLDLDSTVVNVVEEIKQ